MDEPCCVSQDFFGKPAPAGGSNDPITNMYTLYPVANCFDYAGHFTTRRKRHRRLKLVLPLDNQGVGEVDSTGFDAEHDLTFAWLKRLNLFDDQAFRWTIRFAQHGLHGRFLLSSNS